MLLRLQQQNQDNPDYTLCFDSTVYSLTAAYVHYHISFDYHP
uniref:Uncharacterized protein n=1 Tax=uncultured bacterium A1Q1_fos_2111 TaxID=1256563 RepID=L7VYX2_9BACT|nr:hypothetical protein [uncultured bacterium A1Q1_fos_2111]